MIDRTGQLWEMRISKEHTWLRYVVVRSDWGPDILDYCGGVVYHKVVYLENLREGDVIENLEHHKNRWENRSDCFRRFV